MFTFPESFAFYVNLIIAVFYILFVFLGWRKGFFLGIISAAGSVLAFFVSWRYASVANNFLHLISRDSLPLQDTLWADQAFVYANEILWFAVLFILCNIVIFVIERLISSIQNAPVIHQISSLLGGVMGFVAATIWVLVFSALLNTPLFTNGGDVVKNSALQIICDTAGEAVESIGVPVSKTDVLNKLYTGTQDLSENDKAAIQDWLEAHGFEKLEDAQEFETTDETEDAE